MKSKACRHCDATWHKSFQCFYKPPKEVKPCRHCFGTDHFSWQCYANRKRATEMKVKLSQGKVSRKWLAARKKWYRQNKSEHYECYICGKWMTNEETTLDHIKSRSRHPELRYELTNLAPCCWQCNEKKGSRDIEELEG